jgi:hypothetical protein
MTEIANLGQLITRVLMHLTDDSYRDGFCEPFQRGSAEGKACIVESPETPGEYEFQVQMGIMWTPDDDREVFYRRLLEVNHGFRGRAAFCVDAQGMVSLVAARPVLDLDSSEVVDLILWTSQQADRFDDVLLKEFGYELAL